jgi:hypothetical protein
LAKTRGIAFGRFALSRLQHPFEDQAPHLGNIRLAVQDNTTVYIHFFDPIALHAAIGSHAKTGYGYAAHHRAAADGEAKHIGPAHHHPDDGYHIITGNVHEYQPFSERRISIVINRLARNITPFGRPYCLCAGFIRRELTKSITRLLLLALQADL